MPDPARHRHDQQAQNDARDVVPERRLGEMF